MNAGLAAEQFLDFLLIDGQAPVDTAVDLVDFAFWSGVLDGAPMPLGWTLDTHRLWTVAVP